MANWERVDNLELDDVESSCVEEIFQLLIEQEIADNRIGAVMEQYGLDMDEQGIVHFTGKTPPE